MPQKASNDCVAIDISYLSPAASARGYSYTLSDRRSPRQPRKRLGGPLFIIGFLLLVLLLSATTGWSTFLLLMHNQSGP